MSEPAVPKGRRAGNGHRLRISLAAVVVLLAGVPAWSQTSQAVLQGQVTAQATGQPIGRALVIVRNLQTNTQGYRYTNEQGFYFFPALLPGTYSVRVDALGFLPEQRSAAELPVASRIELNFSLEGGGPLRPVSPVSPQRREKPSDILAIMYGADAAVPQAMLIRLPVSVTETLIGAISSLIDERKIQDLPLSGRDVYTLLVLQPSVTSDNATARGLGFSVNGQRVASSNFLLDGVDNNDLLVTGPATFVSADAVKEYRMTTNNFTAEFGRSSGFIANAITRTGTNLLHGTVFEFFNHDLLNANSFSNNWQGLPKVPFRQNQFGGSLGGPVRRDRLFFFANAERFQSSSRSQLQQVFLPSPLLVSLSQEGTLAKQLLTQFPAPPGEPLPFFPFAVTHTFTQPLGQGNTLALGRLDYNSPGGLHRLSGRYSFSQQTAENVLFSVYPGLNAPLAIRGQNLALNHIRDWYGGTNELKFGLNRNTVRALRPHPEIPTLQSGEGIALPGSGAAYDYFFRDTVLHVLDNFSRLSANHALGVGFEWRPALHHSLLSLGRDGFYSFGSIFDFLNDSPSFLFIPVDRQTGLPATDASYRRSYLLNDFAAFFQDNWKLTRRLTLNLGMRYEYFGPPKARGETRDYNFVFGEGRDVGERIASGRLQPGPLFRPDRNNFAPRVGFALDLLGTGRLVLRGGYGIFFDRLFNNIWMDARINSLSLQTLLNERGRPAQFQYTIPARNSLKSPVVPRPDSTVAVDQALRTPYGQSWFVGFQQELAPDFVVEVNQTGSLGRKLITSDTINRWFSLPSASAENIHRRFNPSQPDITYRANQGHSNHLALQVALNRRWGQGVQFQASYTLSRTRDVQSDPFGRRAAEQTEGAPRFGDSSFFNISSAFTRQFDPSADFGRSDFDQTHNLVFNLITRVPRISGWGQLMGSWQGAILAGFRSGFPFSVYTVTGNIPQSGGWLPHNFADFLGENRDEAFLQPRQRIPGGVLLLDPSQFRAPAGDRLGNFPRNALRGPGFWNVDFALSRTFALPRFGEQASLLFRAEFFNLFNHTNLNNPRASLECQEPDPLTGEWVSCFGQAFFGRQGFGASLPSASPLNEQPRRIQFALKIYF